MQVVIDSHALFWFLTNNPKLSRKARHLIENSEQVIIPSIVLMEILYLLEKNNLSFKFVDFLSELKIRNYLVYPLDLNVISQTLSIDSKIEMHDRIIIAIAQIFNADLISRDNIITRFYSRTIW